LQPSSASIGNGPAKYFRFPGAKGSIGFITPVSEHFCISCNRLRLTSDGKLRLCLLAEDEVDLKQLLRSGISQTELKAVFEASVARKPRQHHLSMSGSDAPSRPMRQVGG
jgi:cyclic pyranopterin phosphate synthase